MSEDKNMIDIRILCLGTYTQNGKRFKSFVNISDSGVRSGESGIFSGKWVPGYVNCIYTGKGSVDALGNLNCVQFNGLVMADRYTGTDEQLNKINHEIAETELLVISQNKKGEKEAGDVLKDSLEPLRIAYKGYRSANQRTAFELRVLNYLRG